MIRSHLAQANGHIAELTVQITRQRVIVKYALDTGQPSELSESLLHALEESLGAFKKHRELVLADDAKRRATQATEPSIKSAYEKVAEHWMLLARLESFVAAEKNNEDA